jgi:hypothetical protein
MAMLEATVTGREAAAGGPRAIGANDPAAAPATAHPKDRAR